jgi:hypothetical protein
VCTERVSVRIDLDPHHLVLIPEAATHSEDAISNNVRTDRERVEVDVIDFHGRFRSRPMIGAASY